MIIAISDRTLFKSRVDYINHLTKLLSQDIDYLILREKDLPKGEILSIAREIISENNQTCKHKLIIHKHLDIAEKLGLTTLHLPETMIDTPKKDKFRFSYSIHNKENLTKVYQQANFVLISPIFITTCKPYATPLSTDYLTDILQKYQAKTVALGGLYNYESIKKAKEIGFTNIAMRSSLMESSYLDMINICRQLGF